MIVVLSSVCSLCISKEGRNVGEINWHICKISFDNAQNLANNDFPH